MWACEHLQMPPTQGRTQGGFPVARKPPKIFKGRSSNMRVSAERAYECKNQRNSAIFWPILTTETPKFIKISQPVGWNHFQSNKLCLDLDISLEREETPSRHLTDGPRSLIMK